MPEYSTKSFKITTARLIGAAALAAAVASLGCGSSSGNSSMSGSFGASQPVADGTAFTYVTTDQNSVPHAIGVSMKASALDNSPTVVNYPNALAYTLPLPANTPSGIPFRSVTLFTTAGHSPDQFPPGSGIPGPYTVPHLHIAFSLYTNQQRQAIGARLWNLPPAIFNDPTQFPTYFDSNFDLPVNAYYVPLNAAIHTHYVDYSSTPPGQELPTLGTVYFNPTVPEFNPVQPGQPAGNGGFGAFTTEVDYAFFAGNLSSYNITSNLNQLGTFVNSKISNRLPINLTLPLDMPQGFQTSGYYPTNYSIKYDPGTDSFKFELGGLTYFPATDTNGNPIPQAKKK